MKTWKRIAALCLSVSTMGVSLLSTACNNGESSSLSSSSISHSQESIGESSADSTLKEHTHVWKTEVAKSSTCTEKGLVVKTCDCGEEEYVELPAGHDLTRTIVQEASCTQAGLVEITCKNCEYKTYEEEPQKDHLFLFGGDCHWCGKSKEEIEGGGGGGVVDHAETTIRVASFNGGIGLDWLREAAVRFERLYEYTSFEEGRMGIVVSVVDSRVGDMLAFESLKEDVYLTEGVDYYFMQSQGKFADISDVVQSSMEKYGEYMHPTIEQKMDPAMRSYLTAKDGKYYAIPFYDGFYGFIYDVDMFETNGWFFDEAGNFTKTSKSAGLDGIEGTYDDGMPKTYAQFAKLVDKIRHSGITPFVYSAETENYFIEVLSNYWATYEGKESMQLNWSLNGETNLIAGWDGNTPIMERKTITDENRFDLQKQAGKYYALQFMRDVVTGDGENYTTASDLRAAQLALIQSHLAGEVKPGAVAMVIDGSWFENGAELSGAFELMARVDMRDGIAGKDYKTTRKFAFMPIPMVDETCSTKQTLISSNNESYCFINAATAGGKLEAAKEFLKFLHTDAELCKFNKKTSITRPYTYAMSDADRAEMSYYGQSLLQMKETVDIVYPYSGNLTYIANSTQHRLKNWAWTSKYGGSLVYNPFIQFNHDAGLTAKTYFEGLYNAY